MVTGSYRSRRRRTERGCVRLDRCAVPIANGRHVEHDSVEAGRADSVDMSPQKKVYGNSECETKPSDLMLPGESMHQRGSEKGYHALGTNSGP
jgi:hypothetical protein